MTTLTPLTYLEAQDAGKASKQSDEVFKRCWRDGDHWMAAYAHVTMVGGARVVLPEHRTDMIGLVKRP